MKIKPRLIDIKVLVIALIFASLFRSTVYGKQIKDTYEFSQTYFIQKGGNMWDKRYPEITDPSQITEMTLSNTDIAKAEIEKTTIKSDGFVALYPSQKYKIRVTFLKAGKTTLTFTGVKDDGSKYKRIIHYTIKPYKTPLKKLKLGKYNLKKSLDKNIIMEIPAKSIKGKAFNLKLKSGWTFIGYTVFFKNDPDHMEGDDDPSTPLPKKLRKGDTISIDICNKMNEHIYYYLYLK